MTFAPWARRNASTVCGAWRPGRLVIPWLGVAAAPGARSGAAHARGQVRPFETRYAPEQMPNQGGIGGKGYPWPYVEGAAPGRGAARPDAVGYRDLWQAPGGPERRAGAAGLWPWKYGFEEHQVRASRSILVSEMPVSFWMQLASNEYGFYANVNPEVPHPRWSQATERRIGDMGRRETCSSTAMATKWRRCTRAWTCG